MKRKGSVEVEESEMRPQRTIELETASALSTLQKPVSPPQIKRTLTLTRGKINDHNLAAIEAGEIKVDDHLGIFSTRLSQYSRPISETTSTHPRLPIAEWVDLYRRNEHAHGCHFVIHQHDHPIAGPHYDLRLQFSATSSVSWSIMYGLPGDPNSQRQNRNATETRVHCLWNHLVETASLKTGSMIIWDTGEYEILPYEADTSQPETDDSRSEKSSRSVSPQEGITNSEKLQHAFSNRKIRLRLHGTRLPKNYTVILRMDKSTDYARPIRKGPKRRRKALRANERAARAPSTSESGTEPSRVQGTEETTEEKSEHEISTHSDNETDVQIQVNNAYPGSTNTIGSIHQRRWYLSLDRQNSGFEQRNTYQEDSSSGSRTRKRIWVRRVGRRNELFGFEPFYVRGPNVERSVVTGRRGQDVLNDEGVEGFIPRQGWRPTLN
ncbi:hypothetical protein N7493_003223 [Penicillium malachiteum]|uniref:DNA ligase D 3'-phosphoesterase domain-containing protein n=1 Tax=Penicillium malachiteum TaxID=1324776 RepID=A0AAD6HTD6_9EURO|nr:hypothetical protein N7493_003223 [Penicillium malachiteum]